MQHLESVGLCSLGKATSIGKDEIFEFNSVECILFKTQIRNLFLSTNIADLPPFVYLKIYMHMFKCTKFYTDTGTFQIGLVCFGWVL